MNSLTGFFSQACGANLREKLGQPVATPSVVSLISEYMVERYGFSPECKVVAFTGDNPAALAGQQVGQGDLALSLGPSDTAFVWMTGEIDISPEVNALVSVNPIEVDDFMALLW